ncbi:MAG TPA: hypothetical protein DFS52_00595 [Myxococcales bacterium]|nr:hypothetical protein [Myxococcales bacterium]
MSASRLLAGLVLTLAVLSLTGVACSGGELEPVEGHDAAGPKDKDAGYLELDAGWLEWDGGSGGTDGGHRPDAACVATSAEATLVKKPVDIVFLIDNSASMDDEIEAVQQNINNHFARIIGESGIDYRVIVIGLHGPTTNGSDNLCRICVEAPLSTTTCEPVPGQPGINPPVFFHYSTEVRSHDSVCVALNSFASRDPLYGLAPDGWRGWLRPQAHKHFVELTDDGLNCRTIAGNEDSRINDYDQADKGVLAAESFDSLLLALSPEQFGSASERKYTWHSIINLRAKPAGGAYLPTEPIESETCAGSGIEGPGTGYQALSQLTGGLRFPICERGSYDEVFREIATGVIEGAVVDCEYPIPEAPPGKTIDLTTVVIGYTPGSGGEQQIFSQVTDASRCTAGRFFIADDIIRLCPETCATVQADEAAKVVVLYGCKVELN